MRSKTVYKEIMGKYEKRASNFEKNLELGGHAMICLHHLDGAIGKSTFYKCANIDRLV